VQGADGAARDALFEASPDTAIDAQDAGIDAQDAAPFVDARADATPDARRDAATPPDAPRATDAAAPRSR